MITVENLTKRYGNVTAVDNLSFKVEKGEILGFLGPNGAGKTTTMRILTCFMPPSSGTVTVAGFDCFDEPLEVKRRIGYLPESAPLYKEMTPAEYLDFAAGVKGLKGAKKKEKIAEVMAETAIAEVQHRLIGKLSKGYRQRVGLAQALLNDPEVLVLDEPTAGLDPKQIVEIRTLIKGMAGKRTIILSTHILPEVSLLCNRVVIIHKGKMAAVDTPQNLVARRQKKNAVHLTLDAPLEEARSFLASLPGVIGVSVDGYVKETEIPLAVETEPGRDLRREIAQAVVQKGYGLLEMKAILMSLEEIFVDLVTEEKPEGPGNG
ncbi:MAG: ATP-binding cassette domain-containing protein [Nitrospinae bacterium]|nr:ATP-binding cassette domain-containing protein [Nitrospinota bacterium]